LILLQTVVKQRSIKLCAMCSFFWTTLYDQMCECCNTQAYISTMWHRGSLIAVVKLYAEKKYCPMSPVVPHALVLHQSLREKNCCLEKIKCCILAHAAWQ